MICDDCKRARCKNFPFRCPCLCHEEERAKARADAAKFREEKLKGVKA
jgi:hypothetical protein